MWYVCVKLRVKWGDAFKHWHQTIILKIILKALVINLWWRGITMMTSSNGNIFRVTGPLWGEFPSHRPLARSSGVSVALRLDKRLSKQSRRWWFETPSRSLWRHCNEMIWIMPCEMSSTRLSQSLSVQRLNTLAEIMLLLYWYPYASKSTVCSTVCSG